MSSILVSLDAGVLSITLNRPDKLNAFNPEMHQLLKAALERARDESAVRAVLLTGAGRGFLRRAGSLGAQRQPGRGADRPLGHHRLVLQPAGAPHARAAQADRLRGERHRRRRRRQHRARLRPGARGALGELPAGVLAHRAAAGFRRHLFPAAARRHGARDGPRAARRQALRRGRRALGPDLEGGRRRSAHERELFPLQECLPRDRRKPTA